MISGIWLHWLGNGHPRHVPIGLSGVVARNARATRAAQQRRQRDVAAKAGISRSNLSRIEGGNRLLSIEDIRALCLGLGVTLTDLLAGADPEDLETLGLADGPGRPGAGR